MHPCPSSHEMQHEKSEILITQKFNPEQLPFEGILKELKQIVYHMEYDKPYQFFKLLNFNNIFFIFFITL